MSRTRIIAQDNDSDDSLHPLLGSEQESQSSINPRANDIANQVAMQTGGTHDQEIPETLYHANEKLNLGFHALLFTLLSNIKGIASIIASTAKYLFPIAFALKTADWFLYAWRYLKSSNKNAGKTNNLILKTATTAMIGLVVFGGALLGTTLSPLLFAAVMVIDVSVSLGKALYFGYSAYNKPKHERDFFLGKVKENAIKTVVGGILLGALVVTFIYGSPAIAAGVVAGLGITAAATLVGLGVMGLVNWFRGRAAAKVLRNEIENTKVENVAALRNRQVPRNINGISAQHAPQVEYTTPFKLAKNGFFSNHVALLKPMSNNFAEEFRDLKTAIAKHSRRLTSQIAQDKDSFIERRVWSQGNKRTNKLHAIEFLNHIMDNFHVIVNNIRHAKPVKINGIPFANYHNVDDLMKQIDKHVTSHIKGSYQSFFADVGGVEALFKQTYKLITKTVVNGMTQVDVAKPMQMQRRTGSAHL